MLVAGRHGTVGGKKEGNRISEIVFQQNRVPSSFNFEHQKTGIKGCSLFLSLTKTQPSTSPVEREGISARKEELSQHKHLSHGDVFFLMNQGTAGY